MAKYLFVYHGGVRPLGDEETIKAMAKWGGWFGSMGADVIDAGNPVGKSQTVMSDGSISSDGHLNPMDGYSLLECASLQDALNKAKKCPVLTVGGSVEVAETFQV